MPIPSPFRNPPAVMRTPFWLSESFVREALRGLEYDAALTNRKVKVTVGHRFIRVDETA